MTSHTTNTMTAPAPITFLGEDTPAKVFRQRSRDWADQPALRYKQRGLWQSTTWAEYFGHARAMGLAQQPEHDRRYDQADEYLQVLYKLWEGSWEEGAILRDRERRIFSDPSKIHEIRHVGKHRPYQWDRRPDDESGRCERQIGAQDDAGRPAKARRRALPSTLIWSHSDVRVCR